MTRSDAALVAEDVARWLTVRASMLLGIVVLIGAPASDGAMGALAVTAIAVGALAFLLPPVGLLMGWSRSAQWMVSGSLLVASGVVLGVLVHRG